MRFYFRSNANSVVYSFELAAVKYSSVFAHYNAANPLDYLTEETALVLDRQNNCGDINNEIMLETVCAYLQHWGKNIDKLEDYVVAEPIITQDLWQILEEEDINIINQYIVKAMGEIDQCNLSNVITIKLIGHLSKLIEQLKYLEMAGFVNKIYAYIAVVIYGKTLFDLHEAEQDPKYHTFK